MMCLISEPMKKNKYLDVVKANRKGSRDFEIENSTGWNALNKVHKSKKEYRRKTKYPNDLFGDE